MEITAEQAIENIKRVKTQFMGHTVNRYNYAVEIREQLTAMAERNELSPIEYYRALSITLPLMSDAERGYELTMLEGD